ncbi:transmembrane protein, putative (macronuclear) [Tetrahymena thermophila SB210]|uniref:Transmembrane protein, putative n=1 Tax=Tetrahymena thermophila (strain SB210) TaxID=312017 RepID=W7XIB4_TETTS|nr:transmembrane protein, putative [Tetrahymena thermophila SB210]EWS74486.1 transmembrane protein, putative [Tetrahymena thermophila SB210]|eukprot:XP_012652971.1 transmembrane protein, putative [Tetrahymena thermophila SB210]
MILRVQALFASILQMAVDNVIVTFAINVQMDFILTHQINANRVVIFQANLQLLALQLMALIIFKQTLAFRVITQTQIIVNVSLVVLIAHHVQMIKLVLNVIMVVICLINSATLVKSIIPNVAFKIHLKAVIFANSHIIKMIKITVLNVFKIVQAVQTQILVISVKADIFMITTN